MKGGAKRPMVCACLIQRAGNELLICRPSAPPEAVIPWVVPYLERLSNESPEATARRAAKAFAALDVEVHVGQPPIQGTLHDRSVIWRFFLCTPPDALVAKPSDGIEELRWVLRKQLCEYDFAPWLKPVIDWYVEP